MSDANLPAGPAVYDAGDVLVAKTADGSFQVSRVAANGRSTYVMGCQATESAAVRMASGATSGIQRVFLRSEGGTGEYRLIA